MERLIFKGTRVMFLPLGVHNSDIEDFIRLGGCREQYCNDLTHSIVASNWVEVEEHFNGYPSLLDAFLSEGVGVLSYRWVRISVGALCEVPCGDHRLQPPLSATAELASASDSVAQDLEWIIEMAALMNKYEEQCWLTTSELDQDYFKRLEQKRQEMENPDILWAKRIPM